MMLFTMHTLYSDHDIVSPHLVEENQPNGMCHVTEKKVAAASIMTGIQPTWGCMGLLSVRVSTWVSHALLIVPH